MVVAGCVLAPGILPQQFLQRLQRYSRCISQQSTGLSGQHVVVMNRDHCCGIIVGAIAELNLNKETLGRINRSLEAR